MANIHYVEGRNYLGKGICSVTSILKGFSELQSLGPTFRFLTWQPSLTFLVLESQQGKLQTQAEWKAESWSLPLPQAVACLSSRMPQL